MDAMTAKEKQAVETLESMVDSHGIVIVTRLLAEVCRLKAEHIRENWQDEQLAKAWDVDAKRLDMAADGKVRHF